MSSYIGPDAMAIGAGATTVVQHEQHKPNGRDKCRGKCFAPYVVVRRPSLRTPWFIRAESVYSLRLVRTHFSL